MGRVGNGSDRSVHGGLHVPGGRPGKPSWANSGPCCVRGGGSAPQQSLCAGRAGRSYSWAGCSATGQCTCCGMRGSRRAASVPRGACRPAGRWHTGGDRQPSGPCRGEAPAALPCSALRSAPSSSIAPRILRAAGCPLRWRPGSWWPCRRAGSDCGTGGLESRRGACRYSSRSCPAAQRPFARAAQPASEARHLPPQRRAPQAAPHPSHHLLPRPCSPVSLCRPCACIARRDERPQPWGHEGCALRKPPGPSQQWGCPPCWPQPGAAQGMWWEPVLLVWSCWHGRPRPAGGTGAQRPHREGAGMGTACERRSVAAQSRSEFWKVLLLPRRPLTALPLQCCTDAAAHSGSLHAALLAKPHDTGEDAPSSSCS